MNQPQQRPLSLHQSALSNEEYDNYTQSLRDLTDATGDWENVRVSMNETRGWLRGRYRDEVAVHDIDQILSYFHPDRNPLGVLTGGEYFAVLRLIHHARDGKELCPDLVFVQANISVPPSSPTPTPATTSSNPFARSAVSATFSAPQPFSDTVSETAFSTKSAPPLRSASFISPVRPPLPQGHPSSSNPFLSRSKSISSSNAAVLASQFQAANSSTTSLVTPPLPPRKSKPLLPPPRHSSQVTPIILTTTSPSKPSLKTKPVLNPLMQQSLRVAKAARDVQEVERSLAAQRYTQVISRTPSSSTSNLHAPTHFSAPNGNKHGVPPSVSSSSSASSRSSSIPPPSARVRPPIPPKSKELDLDSITSYERIANTKLAPPTLTPTQLSTPLARPTDQDHSPFDSPPSLPSSSPATRPFRSASLHNSEHHSPFSPFSPFSQSISNSNATPPLPPPRRKKRPESVQVFPSSPQLIPSGSDSSPAPPSYSYISPSLSQAISQPSPSTTSSTHSAPSVKHSLHKTLSLLQSSAEHAVDRTKGNLLNLRSARDPAGQRLVESDDDAEIDDGPVHSFEDGDGEYGYHSPQQSPIRNHGEHHYQSRGVSPNRSDHLRSTLDQHPSDDRLPSYPHSRSRSDDAPLPSPSPSPPSEIADAEAPWRPRGPQRAHHRALSHGPPGRMSGSPFELDALKLPTGASEGWRALP